VKKNIRLIILAGAALVLAIFVGARGFSGEDNWICVNGELVKHGMPIASKPITGCAKTGQNVEKGNIVVISPKSGERIGPLIKITGEARVFENQLNWRLKDINGKVLAAGTATANAPDAGQYGPFSVSSAYIAPTGITGALEVFDYSAKDGSEIDKTTVPVTFK